jgi:mannose-1-phosphate guanylyltransferase
MQIEALKAVGVDEVVLAINYQPEVLLQFTSELDVFLCSAHSHAG